MNGVWKKLGLGLALGATALTAAAPAEAQRWGRGWGGGYGGYYHRDRGDAAAGALIGGIVGLGIGAAIASSNQPRYVDRGYYYNRGYDPYYAPPPRRRCINMSIAAMRRAAGPTGAGTPIGAAMCRCGSVIKALGGVGSDPGAVFLGALLGSAPSRR
ncbi:hypothetical protein GCM10020258_07210 [Sphingomonas yabuuchiae]